MFVVDRPTLERLVSVCRSRGSGRGHVSWARRVLAGFDDLQVGSLGIPDDIDAVLKLMSQNAWVRRHIGWLMSASCRSLSLRSAYVAHTYLHGADMCRAVAPSSSWLETQACGVCLDDADLSYSYLSDVDMRRAKARRCDLHKASFYRGDLRGIDLRGANLTDTSFLGTRMQGCKLLGANLTGAHLMNVVLTEEDIEESEQPTDIFRNCILDKRKQ